jgi:hypothetical protein
MEHSMGAIKNESKDHHLQRKSQVGFKCSAGFISDDYQLILPNFDLECY